MRAFPCLKRNDCGDLELADPGMTLRDYFAAACMPACIKMTADLPEGHAQRTHRATARNAYHMADAMLEARNHSYYHS